MLLGILQPEAVARRIQTSQGTELGFFNSSEVIESSLKFFKVIYFATQVKKCLICENRWL